MTYGTKFRKLREKNGFSQMEVAEAIGFNQSSYSRLESDLIEPKASTLQKLAYFYNVDIVTLYPTLKTK